MSLNKSNLRGCIGNGLFFLGNEKYQEFLDLNNDKELKKMLDVLDVCGFPENLEKYHSMEYITKEECDKLRLLDFLIRKNKKMMSKSPFSKFISKNKSLIRNDNWGGMRLCASHIYLNHFSEDHKKFSPAESKDILNKYPIEVDVISNIREMLVEAIKLISSKEDLLNYQKNVPIAFVTAELFCGWGDSYISGCDIYPLVFNEQELIALEAFNDDFERISEIVGEDLPPIEVFVQSKEWEELSKSALETLEKLS